MPANGCEEAGPSRLDIPVELVRELAAQMLTRDEICAILSTPNYEGKKAQKKRRRGPKFKPIDPKELEKLCALGCNQAEIADWFGVGHATIERRLRQPEYREVMARGRALGRISLRRMQWQAAMAGNPAMLIWLGKQYLGQSNNPPPQASELPSIRVTFEKPDPHHTNPVIDVTPERSPLPALPAP